MNQPKPEKEIRLEKLAELRRRGIDPYPSKTPEHQMLSDVLKSKVGETVATVGRLGAIRGHGRSTFIDLKEDDHKLQLYFQAERLGEKYQILPLLDSGDYFFALGELFKTKTDELTLSVSDFSLLSKSLLPLPTDWHGLTDVETRYRQRALDFKINSQARKIIAVRSRLIAAVREFFTKHGFIEIQTPILQPIPGGAAAKPFVTRYNALEAEFYLRIAPELYLKKLVAGGFERVFEIGPNFRNEGLSHMHNPEFTGVEAYWAYHDYRDLMKLTEELLSELIELIHGRLSFNYQGEKLNCQPPYPVRSYLELIKEKTALDISKLTEFEPLFEAIKKQGIVFENQKITIWSELVDELFKKIVRPTIVQPTFVVDYPIDLQPLAKRRADKPELAEQFQLILGGGFELVKAYSELNDPLDQEARFKQQAEFAEAGWAEAQRIDDNFIEALKFGLPPTAGWGLGIDRLVMLLTDQHSIKEVIPFPTLRPLDKTDDGPA